MSRVILDVLLDIKPLSANEMHYANKRVDTAKYKKYKRDINDLIGGKYRISPKVRLKLTMVAGFSNKASDLDNIFKPAIDSMQLAMGFNDKQIYEIKAYKGSAKRGDEYLYIKLETIPDSRVHRIIDKVLRKHHDTR